MGGQIVTLRTAKEQKVIADAAVAAAIKVSDLIADILKKVDEAAAVGEYSLVYVLKKSEGKGTSPSREPVKLTDTELATIAGLGYSVYYAAERQAYIISWK